MYKTYKNPINNPSFYFPFLVKQKGLFKNYYPVKKSHDQLNNREKWLDYFKGNPIGKLYNFYHEAQEVGLDVSKFSLFDYGDHPYEHRPNAVAYKQSLDYEDIE